MESPRSADFERRLRNRHGTDCQDRVDADFFHGSQFRVLDLWVHFPTAVRGSTPPFVHVVETLKAFPYTVSYRGDPHLVLDQHLIALFQILTRHIVLDSAPDRALVEVQQMYAERLAVYGSMQEAAIVATHARMWQQDLGPTREMHPGNRAQFDYLVRGSWMFTIAHEMAHTMLGSDSAAAAAFDEFDRRSKAAVAELEQVGAYLEFTWPSFEDDWAVLPITFFTNRLRGGTAAHPIDELRGHVAFLREQLVRPSIRIEATCDLLAAAAVWRAMAEGRHAPAPVALATCFFSLAYLTLIQLLDEAAHPAAKPASTKLEELGARLSLLRGCFTADTARLPSAQGSITANELPTREDRRLTSRAMADAARVLAETLAQPMLWNWAALPAVLQGEESPDQMHRS